MVAGAGFPALTLAPNSGTVTTVGPRGSGGVGAPDGFQFSKSAVSNTRPEAVRINREPDSEYQTRSTGPVASPASDRLMAELPTRRHAPDPEGF